MILLIPDEFMPDRGDEEFEKGRYRDSHPRPRPVTRMATASDFAL
ncbi:hypothetical protein VT99_10525 [Candidatus Electrothrix marina]|uniref:Uncharacterized protein n=1 Tax=Candidatus Electrothrix marina TaxID=1859130 RepID=A0A444J6W3_9BACT|nr:hypothetical protein VT99_10525 [Candidatus Electrothrix marina]